MNKTHVVQSHRNIPVEHSWSCMVQHSIQQTVVTTTAGQATQPRHQVFGSVGNICAKLKRSKFVICRVDTMHKQLLQLWY